LIDNGSSDKKMSFSTVLGFKDKLDLLFPGLRPHPIYSPMGPYPYSLLSSGDVPQFSPW
jgi:hypothetical protein